MQNDCVPVATKKELVEEKQGKGMTVYELIQTLAKYEGDVGVDFIVTSSADGEEFHADFDGVDDGRLVEIRATI